jgi:hypothetical protein
MYRLPEKKDFLTGGQFSTVKINRHRLPTELLSHIFPDYTEMLFKQKPMPTKKTLRIISDFCISLKKTVKKEEREMKRKQRKEIETKLLEDKIKDYFNNYYKNLYKNCKCQILND